MFSGVRYYLSESLDSESRSNLEYVLNQHGAQRVNSAASPECTHIISNSSVFEGWQLVRQNAVVVTEAWVTRSVLFKKQQNPQHYSTDPGMLFSGVCACASELQTGDIEILSAGITSLGGQWRSGLAKDVTHLFVLQSGSEKYEHAMEFRGHTGLKVIVPHWFDDSVKLGVRDLDTKPYEWPEPEVFKSQGKLKSQDTSKRNIQLDPEKEVLLKIAAWSPSSKVPTAPRTKVYGGRKILLSTTLELGGRRKAIEAGIDRADGHVVSYEANDGGDPEEELNRVDECDIYITKFRTGPAYYKAVRARKTIGTLQWMFHVQATGVLTRPLDQLLHYPIPPKPIENFASHEITITNYTGEARDYLKKLIAAMGAQFTPTMSPRNTVLIAADTNNGAKTERAYAWSIPIVNHTWLEDCFVQWRNLTIGTEKYLSHPPGYNFYSCLGRRGYSKAVEDLEELVKREAEEEEEEDEEALKAGGMPPGTENSARDAKEVANAIEPDLTEVDEEPLVNGDSHDDDIEMRPMTPKSSPATSARGNIVAVSSSGRHGRVTQRPEKDRGDVSDEGETAVSRSKRKPAVMSSRRKSDGVGDADSAGQEVTKTNPSSSWIKRPKKKADGREAVAEGKRDSTGDKKGLKKFSPRKPARISDTEEDDVESEEELLKRHSTRKGKAKDDDHENDITITPTKKGESSRLPTKHTPVTPSRSQVSVVVPPFNLHQSPGTPRRANGANVSPAKSALVKSKSIHVSANEQAQENIRPTRISELSAPLSSPPSAAQRSSKRSAATKATQRLHDTIMPDVMLYQQEMKRSRSRKSLGPSSVPPEDSVSGKCRASTVHQDDDDDDEVVSTSRKGKEKAEEHSEDEVEKNGGRKDNRKGTKTHANSDTEHVSAHRKRKSGAKGAPDKEDTSEPGDDTEVEGRQQKKRKLAGGSSRDHSGSPSTIASVRMLTTQVTLNDNVNKALAKLGVKMASKPWDCTHLVVKQLVRTEKFLCAVAAGASIVTEKWAIDSAAAKKLLPEDKYILKDPAGEKKYNFLLKDALERARSRDGRFLDRQTFYVTPKVSLQTDPKMLKSLIIACGGQYMTQTPTQRILDASEDRHVISCPDDASIWRPFANKHPVYTYELLLTGILKQEIDWESDKFRVPGSF
ncbi:brct domain containing protein [Moniliophthora roreri MCA 2997]|uniref:Brct domain containing protein n=1 Tax=Moniliophthora roreri (strain MCA 2997) TaxID=1381753 RepID=V2XUK5_MONRO|nr:brct domain containing protein [Moniliophthora roreri MCA 2997]